MSIMVSTYTTFEYTALSDQSPLKLILLCLDEGMIA